MRLGLVLLAIFTAMADARPRRPPPDLEPEDLPRCDRGKTWPQIRTCLERRGANVSTLFEADGAKLVAIPDRTSGDAKPMRLYVQIGDEWQATSYSATDTAVSELLRFKRIAAGYRIDQGQLVHSSVTLGTPGTSVRVWLRRRLSTVCFAGTTVCRTIITACDAMIDGKTYWSFRGTLHEKDKSLFVVGDKSRAGAHCAPSRPTFRDEPLGEPLE